MSKDNLPLFVAIALAVAGLIMIATAIQGLSR